MNKTNIKTHLFLNNKILLTLLFVVSLLVVISLVPPKVSAAKLSDCAKTSQQAQCVKDFNACKKSDSKCRQNVIKKYIPDQCGEGKNAVKTKFNFGCQGKGSPIMDLLLTLLRFLSIGVGVAAVVFLIFNGIRYATSEGNPEVTAAVKSRIQYIVLAIAIYMFIFAIIQYLVPGGLFN